MHAKALAVRYLIVSARTCNTKRVHHSVVFKRINNIGRNWEEKTSGRPVPHRLTSGRGVKSYCF